VYEKEFDENHNRGYEDFLLNVRRATIADIVPNSGIA